jgi:hypothetical protein
LLLVVVELTEHQITGLAAAVLGDIEIHLTTKLQVEVVVLKLLLLLLKVKLIR